MMISEEQKIWLNNNYQSYSYKEIAQKFNCTERYIRNLSCKLGNKKSVRYNVNDDYFKSQSANMAYILGFTLADGYISIRDKHIYCLEYCLATKDKEVLEFIKSEVAPENRIIDQSRYKTYKNPKYDDWYYFSRLRITSKIILNDLASYGIVPRKTGKEVLPKLDDKYQFDFLRGVFDGDGCITFSNDRYGRPRPFWSICSANKQFLEDLRDWIFPNTGSIRQESLRKNPLYSWTVSAKDEIIYITSKLYESNTFALTRKKEKLLSL